MNHSAFIPTQFVLQLPNDFQPPQWGAPVLLCGLSVVVDDAGKPVYQPAYIQRPISQADLTPDILQALNNQLAAIGFKLERVEA